MVKLRLALAATCLLAAAPAAAQEYHDRVGDWTISGGYEEGTGTCIMRGDYENGTEVLVAQVSHRIGTLLVRFNNPAWRSIEPDATYRVDFAFDRGQRASILVEGVHDNIGVGFQFITPLTDTFSPAFAVSRQVRLSVNGSPVTRLNLPNTRAAMLSLSRCNHQLGARADAFMAAVDLRYTPGV